MLTAFALNCTLKRAPEPSSTDKLLRELAEAFERQGVSMAIERALDHRIEPGVRSDEGGADQ